MAASAGSGAVRSSALRTNIVRGSYGAGETYRINNWVHAQVQDSFIWVPEMNPKVTVHGVVTGCKVTVFSYGKASVQAHGAATDVFVIMPSFIGNTTAYNVASGCGVIHGHKYLAVHEQVHGIVDDVFLTIVGYGTTTVDTHGTCDKTTILFNGKPALRADENCCVFN